MGALVASEPLTDGPARVGSRWRDVFEDHGYRVELESEVVELEPGVRLRVRLNARAFAATSTQALEEQDGRTRVTTVIETDYKALRARLAAGAITRHAQRQLERDLVALKELVERER
jgi:hypothetical protein